MTRLRRSVWRDLTCLAESEFLPTSGHTERSLEEIGRDSLSPLFSHGHLVVTVLGCAISWRNLLCSSHEILKMRTILISPSRQDLQSRQGMMHGMIFSFCPSLNFLYTPREIPSLAFIFWLLKTTTYNGDLLMLANTQKFHGNQALISLCHRTSQSEEFYLYSTPRKKAEEEEPSRWFRIVMEGINLKITIRVTERQIIFAFFVVFLHSTCGYITRF